MGIVGAAYAYNVLAGFIGVKAGQGLLILGALGVVAFFTWNRLLIIVAFCMVAALLGFLIFNFYPSQVFPGDSLTYAVWGLIATLAILGNFE